MFNGRSAYGGSAWDFCDGRCSFPPDPTQDTRAHLRIFSQWRDAGAITIDQYCRLAQSVVSRQFSPTISRRPTAILGLPSWQQVQNGNLSQCPPEPDHIRNAPYAQPTSTRLRLESCDLNFNPFPVDEQRPDQPSVPATTVRTTTAFQPGMTVTYHPK